MVLVFLLLGLMIIISFISCIILLSTIKIEITKLHIAYSKGKFEVKFKNKIGMYLLNKLKLFEIKVDDEKLKELFQSGKIDIQKIKSNTKVNKETIQLLKNANIIIEEFHLNGNIGTENAGLTAIITGFMNTIIPIILSKKIEKYKKEKYNYEINTVYINQNIVNLELNCIINIKNVHIINIIYIYLKKGRVKENERTSDRRNYAYSHE